MNNFIVEYILPIFLVIFLTLGAMAIGIAMFKLVESENYIKNRVLTKEQYQANAYKIGD